MKLGFSRSVNESNEISTTTGAEALQFDKAEMPDAPVANSVSCSNCQRPISSTYYQIGAGIFCSTCREVVVHVLENAGRFGRAVLFGGGAAVLGAIVWHAIRSATGYEIGLVAAFIGIFVGIAVRKGSMSLGGRKYQILAVVLTYVSITMAYIPPILEGLRANAESSAEKASASGPPTPGGFLVACVYLFLLALASPFLLGFQNILGIIIIGFAIYEAWRINGRQSLAIQGPFTVADASPHGDDANTEANTSG